MVPLISHPGIDEVNAHAPEIAGISRRHGHPARACDRSDLAINVRNRTTDGTALGGDVRIFAGRSVVER